MPHKLFRVQKCLCHPFLESFLFKRALWFIMHEQGKRKTFSFSKHINGKQHAIFTLKIFPLSLITLYFGGAYVSMVDVKMPVLM